MLYKKSKKQHNLPDVLRERERDRQRDRERQRQRDRECLFVFTFRFVSISYLSEKVCDYIFSVSRKINRKYVYAFVDYIFMGIFRDLYYKESLLQISPY